MPLPSDVSLPTAHAQDTARLRYIDALRGLAALLVAWLHSVYAFRRIADEGGAGGGWLAAPLSAIDVGHVGVVVFFLISGFVIPFSIRPDAPAPAASFLIKRFFRLFPAYWLSVPLAAAAIFWIWGTAFSSRELLINLTLLQDALGVRSAEGVYWTLPVEIVFYLLCTALLLLGSLFDPRRIGALAVLLVVAFAVSVPVYQAGKAILGPNIAFWFLNLAVMLWGTLYRSRRDAVASARGGGAAVLLWGLLFCFVIGLPLLSLTGTPYVRREMVAYIAGFAIFLLGTSFVRIETRLTDWLGQISYSIYLFHSIVFVSMQWWLLRQPPGSWWRTQHLGVYMGAGLVVVLIVSTLVYRLVEKPGIDLGHRVAAAWRRRGERKSGSREPVAGNR
jgi:peptidoglycan/LPS O-acetylase OafA/YrhL